jgi:hypothetical protein
MNIEDRLKMMYTVHAEEALAVLVGKNYDHESPSMRLRGFLAKHQQLTEIEGYFSEYRAALGELRRTYNGCVEAAIHDLVNRTQHISDANLPSTMDQVRQALALAA